jgi:hypothetical protein
MSCVLFVSFRVFFFFFFAVRGWAILCFAREAFWVWRIVSDSALVKDLCFCSLRLSVMLVLIRRNSKRLVLLLLLPASER